MKVRALLVTITRLVLDCLRRDSRTDSCPRVSRPVPVAFVSADYFD